MRAAGRILGSLAALGAVALWGFFLFRNPYAPPAEGRAVTFGGLMMFSAVVSFGGAALGAHLAMYLLFFVSFFPVGFYVLGGPGLFSGIGWLNLLYLVAAVLVHRGTLAAQKNRPENLRPVQSNSERRP
jgi:hypothetical protein